MPSSHVSVVIPAFHSDSTIAECLSALQSQTFRDFETIVVNSSPGDQTQQIVTTRFADVIYLEHSTRLLMHEARNRGVARARGELLVFTDPDCVSRPDWLERLVAAHDAGHPVVGGAVGLSGADPDQAAVHLCKFHWVLDGQPPGPLRTVPTANACYSRAAWNAAGPFDGACISGDTLLSWRAADRGYPPWFEPKAVVDHVYQGTGRGLWRERVLRGEDFVEMRLQYEGWSRPHAGLRLVVSPLVPLKLLARAAQASVRCGWGWRFAASMPRQVLGQVGWALGEARGCLRFARGGRTQGGR